MKKVPKLLLLPSLGDICLPPLDDSHPSALLQSSTYVTECDAAGSLASFFLKRPRIQKLSTVGVSSGKKPALPSKLKLAQANTLSTHRTWGSVPNSHTHTRDPRPLNDFGATGSSDDLHMLLASVSRPHPWQTPLFPRTGNFASDRFKCTSWIPSLFKET